MSKLYAAAAILAISATSAFAQFDRPKVMAPDDFKIADLSFGETPQAIAAKLKERGYNVEEQKNDDGSVKWIIGLKPNGLGKIAAAFTPKVAGNLSVGLTTEEFFEEPDRAAALDLDEALEKRFGETVIRDQVSKRSVEAAIGRGTGTNTYAWQYNIPEYPTAECLRNLSQAGTGYPNADVTNGKLWVRWADVLFSSMPHKDCGAKVAIGYGFVNHKVTRLYISSYHDAMAYKAQEAVLEAAAKAARAAREAAEKSGAKVPKF
jgi:hypothetical protein